MRRQKKSLLRSGSLSPVIALFALSLGAFVSVSSKTGMAQQVRTETTSATAVASSEADNRYRIGAGDVLEIRVFNRPQLSRDAVRVEGNGMIRMPLIEGEVRAACLTESELAQEIGRRYLEYQRNPQVDVFIKEYNSQPVAVIGAVNSPGRFQLQRRVRLLELLAFAGGPAERAGRTVQVIHNSPPLLCELPASSSPAGNSAISEMSTYRLNSLLQGDLQANPFIRPGDIVTITEAEQVFVVGNVLKPSTIPLKEKITVSQAIAMAGGTMPDTQMDRVRIIRQEAGRNNKTEIIVDLKAIRSQRAEDVALQANDIVEVPTASGKRFLRSLLNGIVPSAARLPLQVIR
jgi:polysaccharide export outer membrane protein